MKKYISVLLVVILFASATSAFADEISLRNGINFGDSPEIVAKKETLKYLDCNKDKDYIVGGYNLLEVVFGSAPLVQRYRGAILGVNQGNLVFYYDNNNALFEMMYSVKLADDPKIYEKLYSSLNEKYGPPIDNPKGEVFFITSCIYKMKGKYFVEHEEWLIPNGSDYVKIELSKFIDGKSKEVYLSYTNIFASDIENQITMYNESMEAINGDI